MTELQKAIIDSFSLTPQECYNASLLDGKRFEIVFATKEHKDIFGRKIEAVKNGQEFLPEYYEVAKQHNISLQDFRNCNVIQKDYGFKDQRNPNKQIYYILKDGKYNIEYD